MEWLFTGFTAQTPHRQRRLTPQSGNIGAGPRRSNPPPWTGAGGPGPGAGTGSVCGGVVQPVYWSVSRTDGDGRVGNRGGSNRRRLAPGIARRPRRVARGAGCPLGRPAFPFRVAIGRPSG